MINKKIFIFLLSIITLPSIYSQELNTLGSSALTIIINIGYAILGVVTITALFFATKYWRKARNKKKNFKIQAIIVNRDGTWNVDKLGKFTGGDNIDKMMFLNSKETMPVINLDDIRAGQVMLWRYAPGQYAVIPPKLWATDPKNFKIDVINYQMKNFAYLEQRASISRWQKTLSLIQQWAPYITVLLLLILGGIIIWFITKMNNEQYAQIVAARVAECKTLISTSTAETTPAVI